MDLASNKSVSLFEDGPHDTLLDPHDVGINHTQEIGVSKEFSESRNMEKDRVDDFMKTASNFGNVETKEDNLDEYKEDDEDYINERLHGIEDMNDLKNRVPKWKDVHDKDNILVFRNFVEMILTTA
mmetsp:Transcript_62536/g.53047  ORF Transcript_62536/g.53047 Transcript_62536/m.53047 type:complete len:126 (+) Transcript_62536:1368-1745(+)